MFILSTIITFINYLKRNMTSFGVLVSWPSLIVTWKIIHQSWCHNHPKLWSCRYAYVKVHNLNLEVIGISGLTIVVTGIASFESGTQTIGIPKMHQRAPLCTTNLTYKNKKRPFRTSHLHMLHIWSRRALPCIDYFWFPRPQVQISTTRWYTKWKASRCGWYSFEITTI